MLILRGPGSSSLHGKSREDVFVGALSGGWVGPRELENQYTDLRMNLYPTTLPTSPAKWWFSGVFPCGTPSKCALQAKKILIIWFSRVYHLVVGEETNQ